MAVTIRNSGAKPSAVTLGDLKRGDYFVFASSNKDVPNLYQVHGGQYSRKKTGELFNIVDKASPKRGSSTGDKVFKVDVDMNYSWA